MVLVNAAAYLKDIPLTEAENLAYMDEFEGIIDTKALVEFNQAPAFICNPTLI